MPELDISIAMNDLTSPRVSLQSLVDDDAISTLSAPGLYAIYGDEPAWETLGLDRFDQRPLYLGSTEAPTPISRDLSTHFVGGETRSSTVRRSFAALLHDELDLRGIPRKPEQPDRFSNYGISAADDTKLTAWLIQHLEIAAWNAPAGVSIAETELAILKAWLPALNHRDSRGPWRTFIKNMRSVMTEEARAWRP